MPKDPRLYPEADVPGARRRWFVRTGERHAPKAGEWYLSGAIPEAYQALANLTGTPYYILTPTTPPSERIIYKGFWYRREGPVNNP